MNFVGQVVRKGDPLLSIYSPNFLSTQQELLNALRSEQTVGGGQQSLSSAARRRLELWDVPQDEIDQLRNLLERVIASGQREAARREGTEEQA